MKYFAYGSNMSIARLRERAPSAVPLGCHVLKLHDLRFHKASIDGSAKCDAFYTGREQDVIYGALFDIQASDKAVLDAAEGLGVGYDEKAVSVSAAGGNVIRAVTYVATAIDDTLAPYSWYLHHVLVGALETGLPAGYIRAKITGVPAIEDTDDARDAGQRAIHSA